MKSKNTNSLNAFLITSEWNDFNGKNLLIFWGISDEGTIKLIFPNKPVFFIDREIKKLDLPYSYMRKEVKLKSFSLNPIDALYFNTQTDLLKAAEFLHSQHTTTYESDLAPTKRFLMEREINAQVKIEGEFNKQDNVYIFQNPKISPVNYSPSLKIASIDIETNVKDDSIYSYAIHFTSSKEESKIVRVLGETDQKLNEYIFQYDSEKKLMENFCADIRTFDPDIIIGWNVLGFDLKIIEERSIKNSVKFSIGRDNSISKIIQRSSSSYFAKISGRIVLDGPMTLRSAFYSFTNYKLETVAQELLGTGKTIESDKNKVNQINYLFENDKEKLAEYNLTDSILVTEIFKKVEILNQLSNKK